MEIIIRAEKTRILRPSLIVGLVIVLNLFFIFTVQLVYQKPLPEHFCKMEQVQIIPQEKSECLAIGGQWIEGQFIQQGLPKKGSIEPPVIVESIKGYCNEKYTCMQEFEMARIAYESEIFFALIALGIVSILSSFVLKSFATVQVAFSWGGFIALILACVRFWSDMDEAVRVAVLGSGLLILLWLSLWKFRKKDEEV